MIYPRGAHRGVRISGATALVTGASCGIGAAVAVDLARRGATVALVGRRPARLAETAAACRAVGGQAVTIVRDLANDDGVQSAAADARAKIGPIEVLVNCAGQHRFKPAVRVTADDLHEMFNVNFFGAVGLSLELLPEMLARRSGSIINVTSVTAHLPDPGEAVYGASKVALSHWSHTIALELQGTGVSVGVVSPGPINTETAPGNEFYAGRRYDVRYVSTGITRMVERGGIHRTSPRHFGALTALYPSCGLPLRALIARNRNSSFADESSWTQTKTSSLAGLRALVTGAAAGLGQAIAEELVRKGVAVVCADIDESRLAATVAQLEKRGTAAPLVADLRQHRECIGVADAATRLVGPLDILVNGAGVSTHESSLSMTVGTARELFAVNFFAPVHLANSTLSTMVSRKSGWIVNIGSVAGHIPTPFEAAYGASKAALWRWSHNLDMEIRNSGVRSCALSPGPMDTEIWEKDGSKNSYNGKLHPPEMVARAVCELISNPRAQITVPRRFALPGALYALAGRPTRWALRRFANRQSQHLSPTCSRVDGGPSNGP